MYFFKFEDEVHSYQKFVRDNIYMLGNLLIISEQLCIGNKTKNFIDILALDLNEKRLVVLELKNIKAKYNVVGQPIQYYDLILRAEDKIRELLICKKEQINFNIDEINYDPKIMLIVPDFDEQLLRNFTFINGIDISIIKMNLLQKDGFFEVIKEFYEPKISYHKDNLVNIKGKIAVDWNFNEYLNVGINKSKIKFAKDFIKYLEIYFTNSNQKFDVFFYDKKISLMVNGKIWGHIFINGGMFDNFVEVSLPNNIKEPIKAIDLMYDDTIINYKIFPKRLKIKFCQLPTNVLKRVLN